ncbi:hypothetical protein DQ04_12411010 [Trypanosoma grayi]|uniref:hypothetical protein n=1 Tax=Trypanosoma grayi TaxID=71804 RepID=UPI0004F4880F|nr:hypothetical protein DQ04_12411010 [Trypanosoma grayi]KEG06755.1 hypothetical protein DQ04_12411010 [Trypanosoma grayi]
MSFEERTPRSQQDSLGAAAAAADDGALGGVAEAEKQPNGEAAPPSEARAWSWSSLMGVVCPQQMKQTEKSPVDSVESGRENSEDAVSLAWRQMSALIYNSLIPFSMMSQQQQQQKDQPKIKPNTFIRPAYCSQCLLMHAVEDNTGSATASDGSEAEPLLLPCGTQPRLGPAVNCCARCNLALHPACFHAMDPTTHDGVAAESSVVTREGNSSDWTTYDMSSALRFIASLVFKDPNAEIYLRDFMLLLHRFSKRHPSIMRCALDPRNIVSVRERHSEMYSLCCDALADADFVQAAGGGGDGPTMQFLRDMMRFATAVYGQAYQSGFLSSVMWGVVMRGVRRDLLTPDEASNNKAVAEILSMPESCVQAARWSQNAMEPNYCIILDHAAKRIVWAFRGTLSDDDILSDVCAYGVPFCGGRAHEGAVRIVSAVFDNRDTATTLLPCGNNSSNNGSVTRGSKATADRGISVVCELLQRHPDYEITITGHSLGGGVALLFGVRAIREKTFGEEATKRMRVVAFGPMPVLTFPAAQSFENQMWSVVNGCDAVCRLQLNSLDRLAAELAHAKKQQETAAVGSETESTKRCDNGPSPDLPPELSTLTPTCATTAAEAQPTDTEDLTEEMHHPGRVFMLTTPWRPATNRVVEVPHGNIVMHHLFISSHMFEEHLMDRYAEALKEVHLREVKD